MGLTDLDKAGSALGRRKEHPELPGSHSLVPAEGLATGTTHPAQLLEMCVKCRAVKGQRKLKKQADV